MFESFDEATKLYTALKQSVSLKQGVQNELIEVLKLLDEATQRCEEYEEYLRLDDPALEEYKEKMKENEMRERLNDRQLAKEKERQDEISNKLKNLRETKAMVDAMEEDAPPNSLQKRDLQKLQGTVLSQQKEQLSLLVNGEKDYIPTEESDNRKEKKDKVGLEDMLRYNDLDNKATELENRERQTPDELKAAREARKAASDAPGALVAKRDERDVATNKQLIHNLEAAVREEKKLLSAAQTHLQNQKANLALKQSEPAPGGVRPADYDAKIRQLTNKVNNEQVAYNRIQKEMNDAQKKLEMARSNAGIMSGGENVGKYQDSWSSSNQNSTSTNIYHEINKGNVTTYEDSESHNKNRLITGVNNRKTRSRLHVNENSQVGVKKITRKNNIV